MSRLGDAGRREDFQENANKRKMKTKEERGRRGRGERQWRRWWEAMRRGARTTSPPFSPKGVSRTEQRPGFLVRVPPPAYPSAWGVGSIAGQPSRRLACPSSVASRIAPRTLYLATRRPRASAAPQPPVDSQLTLTVSNRSARRFSLCLLEFLGSLRAVAEAKSAGKGF